MDFLKILRALLSGVYKMTDGEIDALLQNADATEDTTLTEILDKDKERVAKLTKSKAGQTFQDGYKKAKAEVLAAHEKEIREKFGIEDEELTGLELVAAVIEKEAPEAGKAALTEEVIKKHPVYLALEKEKKKALTEAEATWKAKLEEAQKGFKKTETLRSVNEQALKILTDLNPVLPGTPKVAQTVQKAWLKGFEGNGFEVDEDGNITAILDAEGKPLEDGHGNPIKFEDFVKSSAENYFEFKANNGGSNGGNDNDKNKRETGGSGGGAKGYPKGIKKPTTIEELSAITNDSKIPVADRLATAEAWNAEHPA